MQGTQVIWADRQLTRCQFCCGRARETGDKYGVCAIFLGGASLSLVRLFCPPLAVRRSRVFRRDRMVLLAYAIKAARGAFIRDHSRPPGC